MREVGSTCWPTHQIAIPAPTSRGDAERIAPLPTACWRPVRAQRSQRSRQAGEGAARPPRPGSRNIESVIGPRRVELWDAARRLTAVTVADLQRVLPRNACLNRLSHGRPDFMRWWVVGRIDRGSHERSPRTFRRPEISRLLPRHAPAGGSRRPRPGISREVLLDPFKELLAAHQRVVVIRSVR